MKSTRTYKYAVKCLLPGERSANQSYCSMGLLRKEEAFPKNFNVQEGGHEYHRKCQKDVTTHIKGDNKKHKRISIRFMAVFNRCLLT